MVRFRFRVGGVPVLVEADGQTGAVFAVVAMHRHATGIITSLDGVQHLRHFFCFDIPGEQRDIDDVDAGMGGVLIDRRRGQSSAD